MSLRKAIEEVALKEQFTLKVKYDGTSEKGRGPTGIAYAIPSGHPDAENPRTRKKYPERQTPQYKKLYKAILKKKAPKLLRSHPINEELEEAPLIQNQIGAVQSMAGRLETMLTKESPKRRIQLMQQIGRLVGIKVTMLPNGKIELR